jgi:hypothetical protein
MPATAPAVAPAPPELAEQFTVHRDRARKYLELVQVAEINTRSLQLREATDPEAVARYADAYKAGEDLPPIVCFRDPTDDILHLADGHHRVAAAKRAQLCELHAIVRPGDRRAAILYAAGSNEQHGLPRTNADKRKVVSTLLADSEWKAWSNRELARVSRTSEGFVRLVRKDVGAEVTEIKRKDGTKQQARNAKAKQPRQTSLLDECGDERQWVNEHWQNLRNLPIFGVNMHETKLRILAALYAYNEEADPSARDVNEDVPMLHDTLALHIGTAPDVHPAGLVASELITKTGKGYRLTATTLQQITDILAPRPAKPVDVPPTRADPGIAVTEIIARLRIALASADTTATAYATKHRLPYLALAKLLATGISNDDTYGPIYDHALTLPDTSAAPAPPADEIPDTDGPEEITAPADPTPSPEVPASAAADPAAHEPSPPLRPLGLRRLDKQREILALRLRGGKLAWQGSDDDLFLLARIAGVPSAPTAWIDAARATARVDFLSALARECADRVQTGETMNARKWPQLAELCRLWSLDHQAIEIEAERAVPA